jgi:hypothetical protein
MMTGAKPDYVRTPATEAAVATRRAELANYLRGLTDPKVKVDPKDPAQVEQFKEAIRNGSPAMADLVQGMLDGTTGETMSSSSKEAGTIAGALAKKIDPNYIRNAQAYKERDRIALQGAQLGALKSALTLEEKNLAAMQTTIAKNIGDMEYLRELANLKNETGSPVIDRWIRAGRREIAGDADVTKFDTQLKIFQSDVGKVITTNGTSGVYTVYGQKEMKDLLSPGMNPGQIEAAIEVFKRDYGNRLVPIMETINSIYDRMGQIKGIPNKMPPLDPDSDPVIKKIRPPKIPPMPTYREIR